MRQYLITALATAAAITINSTDIAAAPTAEIDRSKSPTMGWSSWNTYRVNISDSLIMRQADAMVSTGLSDAGYNHVNIDDGFFGGRDSDGRLLTHPQRFPAGLRPVVDHIHALGLRAGIYSDAGRNTCGNYYDNDTIARGVGFYGHDAQDATFYFIDMGFDFIKVDFCGGDERQNHDRLDLDERERYAAISQAIKATGRDDVRMNVCRWDYPGTWVSDIAFSWRISHDITDRWRSIKDIVNQNLYLSAYCRDGHYNDMDMLEVGRSMSDTEDRTHFGLWCIMSSPLLIGCDLTQIRHATLELLKNKELIALNQDTLHLQAYVAAVDNGCYILTKDLTQRQGTRRCVAVYNPTDSARSVTLRFRDVDLGGEVSLRDVFRHADTGTFSDSISLQVLAHGTEIFVADASQRLMRHIYEAETAFIGNYQEIMNPIHAHSGIYAPDSTCSGGMKAANLGNDKDNYLLWDNVYVPASGRYRIKIAWKTDAPASFGISVDGQTLQTVTCAPADTVQTTTVDATLAAGFNSIRLDNPTAKMPDIDYMEIHEI